LCSTRWQGTAKARPFAAQVLATALIAFGASIRSAMRE
jgi:hypothetical protein